MEIWRTSSSTGPYEPASAPEPPLLAVERRSGGAPSSNLLVEFGMSLDLKGRWTNLRTDRQAGRFKRKLRTWQADRERAASKSLSSSFV